MEGRLAAKQAKPLNGVAQGSVLGSDLSCNTNIHGQAFHKRQFAVQTKSHPSCCIVAKIFRKHDNFLILHRYFSWNLEKFTVKGIYTMLEHFNGLYKHIYIYFIEHDLERNRFPFLIWKYRSLVSFTA